MNPKMFLEALEEKGVSLSNWQQEQFKSYFDILINWNQKVNLTRITNEGDVYLKHFYDSLTVAFFHDMNAVKTICDIGSGAGFPSIPLKIAYPHLKITIVDSLKKRITFLEALVEKLGLEDINLIHGRAEDVGSDNSYRGSFDLVTARAVANLSVLSELCIPLVKRNGKFLAFKGPQLKEELKDAEKAIAICGGQLIDRHEFSLPNDDSTRTIAIIDKVKSTPKKYPRKAGRPTKDPIK